jgi:acetoin utilization deacetylase AcuC-like enzyme
VDTVAYADMAATMRQTGADLGAPVLVCLEGGYARAALAASVLATVEGLATDRRPPAAPVEPASPYMDRHRERWPVAVSGSG